MSGRVVFTKQLEAVQHVRDPTSDLAILSKKGSRLVREKREQAERAKATKFELAGTTLGNVMGVKSNEPKGKIIIASSSINSILNPSIIYMIYYV